MTSLTTILSRAAHVAETAGDLAIANNDPMLAVALLDLSDKLDVALDALTRHEAVQELVEREMMDEGERV